MTVLQFPKVQVLRNEGPMTAAQYRELYTAARREALQMSAATRAKIAAIYREAADQAAEVVKDTLERGLSELTMERWSSIATSLIHAADDLAMGVDDEARALISRAGGLLPSADAEYILSLVRAAGASSDITEAGISRMVASIQHRLISSLATRIWADGQSYSQRVWGGGGVRADWLERIRITVASGIAQGRDPLKIARDIQVYTADGRVALLQRWGALERGTAEFAARIPKNVDWRAVRLVRSELYASLQDAGFMAGTMNPACDGLFDWVLQGGRDSWNCDCESYAEGGPYTRDELPSYPHPNCSCSVRPHLRDQREFISDLKKWAQGGDVDYLDKWNREQYLAAA